MQLLGSRLRPRRFGLVFPLLLLALVFPPAFSQDGEGKSKPAAPKPERPKRNTPPWMAVYRGDYKKALAEFAKLAEAAPTDVEVRLGLARAKDETGDYDGEEACLRQVLELKPDHREARARLADLFLLRGRRDDALAVAESFLKASAEDPIGHCVKGLVLLDRGAFEEAEKELNASLDAHFSSELDDPDDFFHVALAAYQFGNRTGDAGTLKMVAHDLVPKVTELDKFYHAARCVEAFLYLEKDNAPDAGGTFKEVLDLNPVHPLSHVGKAYVAVHDGRLDEAERECARALQVNPNLPDAHQLMAYLHFWDQELDAAMTEVQALLKVDPLSIPAQAIAAAVALLNKDAARLADIERKVLVEHPHCGGFYGELGQLCLQVMRFDAAEGYFRKAIELDEKQWNAVTNRGVVLLHLGREDEGRKLIQEGFDKDSFDTRAYNLLKLFEKMEKEMLLTDHGRFHLRVNSAEEKAMTPYVLEWLARADEALSAKYGFKPESPILVEDFALHKDFSVRTAGIPGLGALGACFGRVVTLLLPTEAVFRMTREFNWSRVLWHEYAHVVTLQLSKNRVPRWFTEGLSVYEEKAANPTWAREMELELYGAYHKGQLLAIEELNRGFTRPKFPEQVLLSYYQASLVCEYIEKKWGFATIPKMLKAYGEEKGTVEVLRECCGVTTAEFDKGFWSHLEAFFAKMKVPPQYGEAEVKAFEERVEKDPKDAKAQAALAWSSLHANKADEAGAHARKALEADPKCADALAVQGYVADDKKDADEARKLLSAAAEAGADYYGVHLRLAKRLLEAKEKDQAIAEFEKAKAAFPSRAERDDNPYFHLAKIYEEAGQEEQVLVELEALRAIDQDDYGLRRRLAERYKKGKKPEEALRVLEEANQIRSLDPELHEEWASLARTAKQYDLAVRELEVAIAARRRGSSGGDADEKIGDLYCELAEVRLDQGKKDEATQCLDDAEYAFPKCARVKKIRERLEETAKPDTAKPEPEKPPAPEKPGPEKPLSPEKPGGTR
ncbi:MAG: tetratricopeptide repeat protein [Planctomycetes bacterium]|nr:tetratricopeptide repeat protein [Planctomycetota bacterium]